LCEAQLIVTLKMTYQYISRGASIYSVVTIVTELQAA
jgi:hypothetical protein